MNQPAPDGLIARLDRVHALIESKRMDDAMALLGALTEQHPDNVEVWFTLGRLRGMQGREADAEAAFSRAAQLRPEMHEAHLNLALSRVYQQKLRESVASFVAARRLQPGSPGLEKALLDVLQAILQQEASKPAQPIAFASLGSNPLVSIVVPTRDRLGLLKDALESVAGQTYGNWELVAVNDGGEDITAVIDALPAAAGAKATVLQLPVPGGQAAARNRAIAASRGEIVAFLDDDDLYLPHHLETLVAGMRESNAGFAYTLAEKVNERLVDGKRVELQRNAVFGDLYFSRELLLVRNFIQPGSWGIRRACFEQCGAFDDSLSCLEDWDLLLRFSERIVFHRIGHITNEVHIRMGAGDSVSTRTPAMSTCKLLYDRYPSRGNGLIDLARELYFNALFGTTTMS